MPKSVKSADSYLRIGLYGMPKSGKSWQALSYPKKKLYIAADPGSEAAALNRLDVVDVIQLEKKQVGNRLTYDPLSEAVATASRDWKKEYPDVECLVWDTMTQTSREILSAIADSSSFSDKHVYVGTKGTESYMAAPMPGDYGATQNATYRLLEFLNQQSMDVIVLFHGDTVEPNSSGTGVVVGGPTAVGKAAVVGISGFFNNLFRTEFRDPIRSGKRVKEYVVHTEKRGPWLAGIRLRPGQVNPIPETVIPGNNPGHFWHQFSEVTNSAVPI